MRRNIGSPLAGRVSSNFGGSVNHRTKKIIAGLLIATIGPLIATTLAASVTIGTGNLEFGQGSQAAVACDEIITTAITESWSSGSTVFKVDTIVLTLLDSTACTGKNLKLSLLGTSGTALIVGTGSETSITVALNNALTTQTGGSLAGSSAVLATPGTSASLTVTLGSALRLNAATVYRVALETS